MDSHAKIQNRWEQEGKRIDAVVGRRPKLGSSLSTASLMQRDGEYLNRAQELAAVGHLKEIQHLDALGWQLSLRESRIADEDLPTSLLKQPLTQDRKI